MANFVDLPPEAFPFRVRIFELDDSDDAVPLLDVTVPTPGVLQIPGFGRSTRLLIEYADGTIDRWPANT